MYITRWRLHRLALAAVVLVGCSDGSVPTGPEKEETLAPAFSQGPVGILSPRDPTAIPIGAPAAIEFSGRALVSRRTVTFPQPAPPTDADQLVRTAAEWIAEQKARLAGAHDRDAARALQSIENLLSAGTPAQVRAALGPTRRRVASTGSLRHDAAGIAEHAVTFRIDGQKLLRVVARARAGNIRAFLECVDEPTGFEIDPSQICGYDPYFDPVPVAIDVATMQYGADATAIETAQIDALYPSYAAKCQAERSAYVGSLLAFGWRASETIWWAWNRNVTKTYTSLRDASVLYGATYALFLRYKECVAGKARGDP